MNIKNILASFKRDATAGTITGLMAIPLTVGICLMSEYPIKIGLYTVILACIVSFTTSLFRTGNYTGTPGIAAGLAPVLAMGIHSFGMQNMPFVIFITAFFQMLVWQFRLEKYILKIVPSFLVEGLLAGVGVKIIIKFFPYTYETINNLEHPHGITFDMVQIIALSTVSLGLFLFLFKKFSKKSPAIPYVATILASVCFAQFIKVPMLHIPDTPFRLLLPLPNFDVHHPIILLKMIGFALMLGTIDVIEQVMSNVAIEKIDPLKRPTNSNNSLLAIWVGNMLGTFFGGMTNLDGLAKSTTNTLAGAVTKLSNLFTGLVLLFFVINSNLMEFLPEFSLAVLMIFSGWKMISGIFHVASEGKYAFMLSLFCGIFVWKLGIFEGLLIALAIHSLITYIIYKHHKTPTLKIFREFLQMFTDEDLSFQLTNIKVETDELTGGKRYRTIRKLPSDQKTLTQFIRDWGHSLEVNSVLNVILHYDYDALLWGTFADDLSKDKKSVERYFEHLLKNKNLKVEFGDYETRQYGDIFIQSGDYEFSFDKKNATVKIPARYSFVCKKDRNSWKIVEHHSSQFPN
ncbi:MAG: SulP family inorganic anion transporter [Flavobacteriia bacterium]|nr:SulP family inorganic anion transporter [Flavobacteriia bacterium]